MTFTIKLISGKDEKCDDHNTNDDNDNADRNYNFGHRFDYFGDFALKPKYRTLKEEVLKNGILPLNILSFDDAYEKAMNLRQNSERVKSIKYRYEYRFEGYGLVNGAKLSTNNVLSVILYCDYDELSFKFSQTFRPLNSTETYGAIQKRNLEFGNLTKYLQQTVNAFGTRVFSSKVQIYYHGISFLYVNKFIARFNGPTSTTTKLAVAYNFAAAQQGIILELGKYSGDIRCFNCSYFSKYPNEDERLYFCPPLIPLTRSSMYLCIMSIHNISSGEIYNKFTKYISILQKIIGDDNNDGDGLQAKVSDESVKSINNLLKNIDNENKCPEYIRISFLKWTNTISKMLINIQRLNHYIGSSFCLVNPTVNNLIQFNEINKTFKYVEEVTCLSVGDVDDLYLGLLLSIVMEINAMKSCKLKRIVLHNVNNCYVPDSFWKYSVEYRHNGWTLTQQWKCLKLIKAL